MNSRPDNLRRCSGFTLLEFLLAISITVLVAAATAAMLTSVATSTEYDADVRESIVRTQALDVRLGSYITPSLWVLDAGTSSMVLWLEDSRESETVHSTEVRWIEYSPDAGEIMVHYVRFPDSMTELEKELADEELPAGTDFWALLTVKKALGYIDTIRLCDRVSTFTVTHDPLTAQGQRLVTVAFTFDEEIGNQSFIYAASLREAKEPLL